MSMVALVTLVAVLITFKTDDLQQASFPKRCSKLLLHFKLLFNSLKVLVFSDPCWCLGCRITNHGLSATPRRNSPYR